MFELGELGEVSFGTLELGELGEVSFGIDRMSKLDELSVVRFEMSNWIS